MQRSNTTVRAAAFGVIFLIGGIAPARAAEESVASRAQTLVQKGDAAGAVDLLESALVSATADERPKLLGQLATAYEAAAKQEDAAGRTEQAEALRDNLQILRRKVPAEVAVPAPVSTPPARAALPPPKPLAPPSDPPPSPRDESPLFEEPKSKPDLDSVPPAPLPEPEPLPAPSGTNAPPVEPRKPLATNPANAPRREPSLNDADAAFRAKRYEVAGAVYAALDGSGKLPNDRRPHWAYCRAFSVVKRINDRPATKTEWASIDAEIGQIATLSPSYWFSEYLRNLAHERSRGVNVGARKSGASQSVVRGASPEEGPVPTTRLQGSNLDWSATPVQSLNFQVYFAGGDSSHAQRVAKAAEEARAVQVRRWGVVSNGGWSPKCEILLYPNAESFSRDTQQPADSPGFSSMGMNAGRLVFRRVNLRVDHPNLIKAILPHEVTHVVLADLFPRQQIPRWADEGLAVLAEPLSEQALRAADLEEPLKAGRLFRLNDLMVMDYPQAEHWGLYYAQSVSLTRFLVDAGTPTQFIKFVQSAQESGFEPALRDVYAIDGYGALHDRWITYARAHVASAADVATSSEAKEKTETTQR